MTNSQINRAFDGPRSPADLLKIATRIRQHALHFPNDPMGERLEKYADELEAQARKIIRGGEV